jgi:HlyD family secretion protein
MALTFALRKKEPAISVQTEKISRQTITETVVANGKIYPVLQVHISPEVSGEITKLPVKEGQFVHKGDLLLTINPDVYIAGLNQAKAGYESSLAAKTTAVANLEKAEADFKRNKELSDHKLLSDSDFIGFKVARDVAEANVESASDQVNVAKAAVDNAQDLLDKTTIVSPLDGTITTLNSQLGERVLGTVQNAGTDIRPGRRRRLKWILSRMKNFQALSQPSLIPPKVSTPLQQRADTAVAACRRPRDSPPRSFKCASTSPKATNSGPGCP